MKAKILDKKNVAAVLDELLKEYEVFAPLRRDGLVVFGRIRSGEEAFLDYANSKRPPKDVLFPQVETLFAYASTDAPSSIETPSHVDGPRLLFGVRPCDARAFGLLDKVFGGGDHKDVYYLGRRASLTVVGLACVQARATCFCTSVGGGPCSPEGSDVLLVDVGNEYAVQVVSEQGARLFEGAGLENAGEDRLSMMTRVIRDAEASISARVETDGLGKDLERIFADPVWDLLTEKCLGCGVCTYLCPTCHCFDILDEAEDATGKRIRIWDTCQFPLFTQQASGMNPRPTAKERLRQRFLHKFRYFVDDYGQIGCVGCGRCIKECPVNVDVRRVLTTLAR